MTVTESSTSSSGTISSVRVGAVGVATVMWLSAPGQAASAPSNATVNEAVKFRDAASGQETGVFVLSALRDALAAPGREAYPEAVAAAAFLLAGLTDYLSELPRVAVTRAGNVAVTFSRDRRYANLECDGDGDVVLTLTDRTTDDEAEAVVVTGMHPSVLAARIQTFLER